MRALQGYSLYGPCGTVGLQYIDYVGKRELSNASMALQLSPTFYQANAGCPWRFDNYFPWRQINTTDIAVDYVL